MSYIKVKDNETLVRDSHSNAVLNTDIEGLRAYYAKRDMLKKEKLERNETKERLTRLEDDMQEIKNLLIKIASQQDNG